MAETSTWAPCKSCTAVAAHREDYKPGNTMHVASGKCSSCDVLRCEHCHYAIQDIKAWVCPSCRKPVRK